MACLETERVSSEGKPYRVPYGVAMASLSGETSALGIQTLQPGHHTATQAPQNVLSSQLLTPPHLCPPARERKQAGPHPDLGGKAGLR